jgi:cytidylate kinase
MAEAMNLARKRWKWQRQQEANAPGAPAPAAFTIALSREAGAGATLVARAVGGRLGWAVYDRELVQHVADDWGVQAALLESVDEKRTGWLRERLDSLKPGPVVSDATYTRRLVKTLLALASHGECVIVGRGGAQVLPPETTLRVRLVGPPEQRIGSVSRRFGIPREEAARRVGTTDRERARFVADHFGKDAADPRQYDLVLNSSRFSVGECAGLIVDALRALQAKAAATDPPPANG